LDLFLGISSEAGGKIEFLPGSPSFFMDRNLKNVVII
jgi:hypothetical protein